MGLDAAYQHVVAVIEQMMCGDGGGHFIAGVLNKLHRFGCGDVLEYHPESRELLNEGYQSTVNKGLFPIKDIAVLIGHLAMHQQRQIMGLHGLDDRIQCAQACNTGLRVSCCAGGVEFDAVNVGACRRLGDH